MFAIEKGTISLLIESHPECGAITPNHLQLLLSSQRQQLMITLHISQKGSIKFHLSQYS